MNKNKSAPGSLIINVVFYVIITAFFLSGCSDAKKNAGAANEMTRGEIIEIRERMFIGQVNNVYLNARDYIGKTIKLEGIFKEEYGVGEKPYYYVIRYGPGCCGDDGNVGFEVTWSENQDFPKPESWVEAVGVLKENTENEYFSYLYLDLSSLTPLNKRGMEYVSQ